MTKPSFRPEIPTALVWDDALVRYRFSDAHPMDPVRLELTERLCRDFGLLEEGCFDLLRPEVAADETLESVHDADFVTAVKAAAAGTAAPDFGLGTEDVPIFADIHDSAARIAQGSWECAEAVRTGRAVRAVNFAGGMHHASRNRASGFCVYNDAAVAVQRLLDTGTQRVVYLDVDAHHGDGTQSIFWDDPRVMTISLHQTGVSLFPGTGFPNEIGGAQADGTAVNLALPPTTRDAGWLRAFHAVVPALVAAFEPEVIVSQHGCDSHHLDPLTDLSLSIDAQRQVALDIAVLAEELCENRWIATGGGGYEIFRVVPRSWAHLCAVVGGSPIPLRTQVPGSWREYVHQRYGVEAPEWMNDDAELWWRSWEVGYDPADPVDRAVIQTRKELFPLYGLDPWFD